MRFADKIAALSPVAIQTIKEAALTLQDLPLDGSISRRRPRSVSAHSRATDAKRGLAAFAKQRKREVTMTIAALVLARGADFVGSWRATY
jgi:enoyl-CoA hydratase/carnithine racemase